VNYSASAFESGATEIRNLGQDQFLSHNNIANVLQNFNKQVGSAGKDAYENVTNKINQSG
jgi:hypothetical protein